MMPRKLIPLTDELHHKESVSKLKTWEPRNVPMPSEEETKKNPVVKKKSKKILSMISQWGSSKKNEDERKGRKFEIFSTKKVSKNAKVPISQSEKEVEEIKNNAAMKGNEIKKLEVEVENEKMSNKINYTNEKNISLESFKPSTESEDELRPQPPSKSPSFILTQVPTKNYFNLIKPKTGIILIEDEKSEDCEKLKFDPREKQKMLDGKSVKIFKRGEEFFVKINDELNEKGRTQEQYKRKEIETCHRAINVKVPQLNLLTPMRKVSTFEMTLGKKFGIQLGSHNILNDLKTMELKGNHALDVTFVAHGMSYRKHPANWSERDIDQILMMGAQMYSATKDIQLDRLSECTKGFTYKNNFIQVKISEPVVIGKILTLTERSMDLFNGLHKFFYVYRQGIFETMRTTLYIVHESGNFYVFDPRGRNEQCERDDNREAALMLFSSIDNVYHLIVNMSKINIKAPFKISSVKLTKFVSKELVIEEFTASCGAKNVRSVDYGIVNENFAVLIGNLSLNSAIFEKLRNRHGLTASIIAMIYAKIDPAISWCKNTLDNVLHFSYQFHRDCLNTEKIVRNLQLDEIPSKFYVGDTYYAHIAIAGYTHRAKLITSRFLFNNPITIALIESFKTFRCLILEIDNYFFAVWRNESADTFFFFDPYQKNVSGKIDHYDGAAVLLMFNTIDHLCENSIERLLNISYYEKTELKIHGMKIIELKKLSKKQIKNRPRFKLANNKCIRPFTANDIKAFEDVPSIIDAVSPRLNKEQQMRLPEKKLVKPLHQTVTDLNSPSLLCFKRRAYEEILASVEKKLSQMRQPDVSNETMEIMKEIYSEMLLKIDNIEQNEVSEVKSKVNLLQSEFSTCGEVVGTAERVLLKTDLEYLEREREELLNKLENPSDETIEPNDEYMKELSLSQEKLIKSHYQELPDKTQIIRGTKSMFSLTLNSNIFDYENYSVLVGISAILASTKYSIHTWSSEIVDYILGCSQIMANVIKLTHRMNFYTNDEHILPKIHINDKFYDLKMNAIANGKFSQLENYLNEILSDVNRILIVTTCGSLAVFNRKNFHYLFEYATCNMVGYRIRNEDFGSSCVMRFESLHGLVRRIYANHSDVKEAQNFVIYRVMITDSDSSNKDKRLFIPFTASQEKIIIDALRHNRMMRKEELIKKLKETDGKVREEKKRLKNYRDITGIKEIPSEILAHTDFYEIQSTSEEIDYELDLSVYDNNSQTTVNNDLQKPMYENGWNELQQIGYNIDDNKIKGTFGYSNRLSNDNRLRACHFASAYAIIYAMHHSFEQMNYRTIDVILENGMKIHESLNMENFAETKTLKQIAVDKMSYELKIEEFNKEPTSLESKLFIDFFSSERMGAIVESGNCSMTIVKVDLNYHIFDPYDANDTAENEEIIENPIASWSLHKNLDSAIEYLLKSLPNSSVIKLHFVTIISSNKLKTKTGYFLFDTPTISDSESKSCEFADLTEDEKIEWVIMTNVIPWSRLEHYNADGVKRYTKDSKWKEYDIEMSKKLYSLWGNIHPDMNLFGSFAGKQHLACCVVALIMSNIFNIDEWDSVLLDSICTHGHKYLVDVISKCEQKKRQLEVSDLCGLCNIQDFDFKVDLELVIFGKLYEMNRKHFNLNRALQYIFGELRLPGVLLVCSGRSLAVGSVRNETFFVYDSQSFGAPLFECNQGTTYVLKCCCMKILLTCIILTLNVQQHNTKFYLYAVKSKLMKDKYDEIKKEEE